MLPGPNDQINTTARADAFTAARDFLPANTDNAEVMRVAEWLLTGSTLLDPAKVQAAARVLMEVSDPGFSYDEASASGKANYEGRAARVVVAYLTGDA